MDEEIIKNIKQYIFDNNISVKKLSQESKIPYHRLWTIINQNRKISIGDYIAICREFFEPLDYFIPK